MAPMPGRGPVAVPSRAVTYCVVPRQLAPKLHDALRRHFSADPAVEVIVEERVRDRRSRDERRVEGVEAVATDRRRIRGEGGRRAGERRVPAVAVDHAPLPRRLSGYAADLRFVERLEPSTQELEDLDTARLIGRIQSGEQTLFAELYMRYFDRVYGYLRIALNDQHDAEDVVQVVFVSVLESLERYERRSRQPFRAWLFRIVRNAAISELRKRNGVVAEDPAVVARMRDEEGSPGDENMSLDWITDRELLMFIERLPLVQRQVLVLRFMLGMTPDETAGVLGRSTTDVRTLQYRALEFLRARLRAVGRETSGGDFISWRRPVRQAQILRNRRFALRGT
jgi:RNA polymerase sigma-70 factor (ECF subfamily)